MLAIKILETYFKSRDGLKDYKGDQLNLLVFADFMEEKVGVKPEITKVRSSQVCLQNIIDVLTKYGDEEEKKFAGRWLDSIRYRSPANATKVLNTQLFKVYKIYRRKPIKANCRYLESSIGLFFVLVNPDSRLKRIGEPKFSRVQRKKIKL